ncbi:hypothetical protein LWI28_005905 [Acer negundo]|uniref:DNA-directed RNA polymerase I subunit RPA12 n=1 Tax=Acer negundo TaxID=4023 RepID=A0AAD5ID99_ACENE|nr:hypothetical protein LWI28_005905 [Acer negundo]
MEIKTRNMNHNEEEQLPPAAALSLSLPFTQFPSSLPPSSQPPLGSSLPLAVQSAAVALSFRLCFRLFVFVGTKLPQSNLSLKECSMAYSQRRDFLFCNYCGTMLNMESKFVTCPLCKFKRNAKEVAGKEISYTVTAEDIRRELGLSLFDTGEDNNKVQWSKVKKACEKCQNPEMHYTTRQTRSADEGQTTHYLCPRCGYQCQES